jgi:hypothetical protein
MTRIFDLVKHFVKVLSPQELFDRLRGDSNRTRKPFPALVVRVLSSFYGTRI